MIRLTLYTKADCCLCDEAREVIGRVRADTAFALDVVDIANRPELERDYGVRVPVVAVNGVPEFELRVDELALRQAVTAAAGAAA